jgi:hypothetical protein
MSGTVQDSMYHRVLRVGAVVAAFILLFESGLVSRSTAVMALHTNQYLANAVGMSASVEPTELNMYTAQLTAQKKLLDDREAAIKDREIQIGLASGENPNQTTTYVLASILFVLLVLIILNYALDYLRYRERKPNTALQTV